LTRSFFVFFSDKQFPALGFGARFPDNSVQHEFALVSTCEEV